MTSTYTQLRQGLQAYGRKLSLFHFNARLYLLYTIISGLAFGIFRLLFNFYVLSLGYDEALLGQLLTTSSLVSLLSALPAGFFSDRLGRKVALFASSLVTTLAVVGMVAWPGVANFFLLNVVVGLAQSLGGVTLGPFLMENSGEEERTYLFSFSSGIQMIAGFAGNWLGGQLPTWAGGWVGVSATSATAYGWAMAAVAGVTVLGLIPLFWIQRSAGEGKRPFSSSSPSPWHYARQHPGLLMRLIAPTLVTSLGAGLLMPFMNIFSATPFTAVMPPSGHFLPLVHWLWGLGCSLPLLWPTGMAKFGLWSSPRPFRCPF